MSLVDSIAEAARRGAPITDIPVIDAHGHLGTEFPILAVLETRLEAIIEQMDRMGVDMFCASGICGCFGASDNGNRIIHEAIQAAPDRIFGYMTTDIGYPERTLPQLESCLENGFRGIKVYSVGGTAPGMPYDHENYTSVFEFANANHLPVLAHVWGTELEQLRGHVERFPNVNWLMAHTGSRDLPKYIQFGRDYPTVFLETCFSVCPRGLIEQLVDAGLEDKVIWGSDLNFMDSTQQIGRVAFAQISIEAKRKILGGNARKALRIP